LQLVIWVIWRDTNLQRAGEHALHFDTPDVLRLSSRTSTACTSHTHLPPSVSLYFAVVHYAQDMIDLSLHHYPYTSDVVAASTAATPISASQRPSVMQAAQTQASSSPAPTPVSKTSFAFLVHSQETIPNNLPPDVDDKPLARQRRRRTRSVKTAYNPLLKAAEDSPRCPSFA